jgi:hypothetical protein
MKQDQEENNHVSEKRKKKDVQRELAHTSYWRRNKRETHVSDANIEFVQGELALTAWSRRKVEEGKDWNLLEFIKKQS